MPLILQEQVRRRGKRLWLLQEQGTGQWSLFRERASAETAKRELEAGRASFCGGCGRWIYYGSGKTYHTPCGEGATYTAHAHPPPSSPPVAHRRR